MASKPIYFKLANSSQRGNHGIGIRIKEINLYPTKSLCYLLNPCQKYDNIDDIWCFHAIEIINVTTILPQSSFLITFKPALPFLISTKKNRYVKGI